MAFREGIPVRNVKMMFISSKPAEFNGERSTDRTTGEVLDELQVTVIDEGTAQADTITLRVPESEVPSGLRTGQFCEYDELLYRSYVTNGTHREFWNVKGLRAPGAKASA